MLREACTHLTSRVSARPLSAAVCAPSIWGRRGDTLPSNFLAATAAVGTKLAVRSVAKIPVKPRHHRPHYTQNTPHLCMPASPSPWTEFKGKMCETGPIVNFSIFRAKLPAVEETPGPAGAPDPGGHSQPGLGASGTVPG